MTAIFRAAPSPNSAAYSPIAETVRPRTREPRRETWRFFWPVLLLALAARLIVSHWATVPVHPDQTFQYLEQAHRLVHGYGVVPWEYTFGIRSWLIPLALAGVLWVGQGLGLDAPWLYIPFLKSVLCIVSLLLPVGMYRLTQIIASERAAIMAFLFGAFWHHFLYFAQKPMPGILAAYALVWMVVLMLRPPSRGRLLAIGLMSGLIFTLRYQLVPVLGLLNLVALLRLRWGFGPVLAGNLIAFGLAGLLDLATWGGFLSSFIDNFRLNFSYDIASTFGRQSLDFYARRILLESGGLVIVAAVGILLLWTRLWPLVIALAAGVVAFHVPAHKEFRFVVWIMPFVLTAAIVAANHPRLPRNAAAWGLCLWGAGVSLSYISLYTGLRPYETTLRDGARVMAALSRSMDVTGVMFRTPSLPWWDTAGYYGFGKPVPLYLWGLQSPGARTVELDHVSHIVTEAGEAGPEGYAPTGRYGSFVVWQSRTPRSRLDLAAVDLRSVYPAPIPPDYRPAGRLTPAARGDLPPRAGDD